MRYDAAGRGRITPDPVLTNIALEFEAQQNYIANRLFPSVGVTEQHGRFEVFGRSAFTRHYAGDRRAPGARANEVAGRKRYAETPFTVVEHALEELTPDEEKEMNPEENPEQDAVEGLVNDIMLGKEISARDLLYDTTQYHTGHVETLGSGEHFDEYDTSDPIALFRDMFRTFYTTLGTIPNTAVIPWKVMSYLEDHPLIIQRYAAQGGVITAEQIATVLGLQRILVPGANYNENNPGQAASLADIWGNNIVLGLVPGRPARGTPALGYEFLWRIPGSRTQGDAVSVDRRRDNDRIGWINRVRRRYTLELVGRDPDVEGAPVVGGMLIENALTDANA